MKLDEDRGLLVTFALLAYNQERFIAEAIRGALSQTYQPLEIILSDDCSTDRTFEIMHQEIAGYCGPHEIRLNRNERNIGFGAHINHVTAMARGQLIVGAAGDDISLPLRVERLYEAYERSGRRALSVFSNATVINEHGVREGPYFSSLSQKHLDLAWLAEHLSGALGCAHAWDRRIFELFGPMDEDVLQEDIVIPFRAALLGEVQFVSESLVLYRRHSANIYFKSAHEVTGAASLYSSLLKHADGKIAIYSNRLKDLETFLRLHPEQQDEVEKLKTVTLRRHREMSDEKALLIQRGFFKRATIIIRAIWNGTPPRRIARWFWTSFFPVSYLNWLTHSQPKTVIK